MEHNRSGMHSGAAFFTICRKLHWINLGENDFFVKINKN